MSNALISVVMPVYNEQEFLSTALDSVLNQTYRNFELIIIDDGSTDATAHILRQYQQKDQRIKTYRQPNSGIVKALNKGIELSEGKYIARMDADDICRKDRLQLQINFLQKNRLHVVGGWVNRFGDKKNKLKIYPCTNAAVKASILSWQDSFAHPAILIDRVVLENHQYMQSFNGIEDMHLWMRLALDPNLRMGNVPDIVLDYRRHANQMTKAKDKTWYVNKRTLAMFQVLTRAGITISRDNITEVYKALQKGGVFTAETGAVVLIYMRKVYKADCFDRETKKTLKNILINNLYKKVKPSGVVGMFRIVFSPVELN